MFGFKENIETQWGSQAKTEITKRVKEKREESHFMSFALVVFPLLVVTSVSSPPYLCCILGFLCGAFLSFFFFFFFYFIGWWWRKKRENGGGLEINFSLPLYVRYFSNMVRYAVVICSTKCVGMSLLRSVLARCYTMMPKSVRGESSRIKRVLNSLV